MSRRLALLMVLLCVAFVLGVRAWLRVRRQLAVEEVCAAAEQGAWSRVLDLSDGLVGTDEPGLRAAECRCSALVAGGDRHGCLDLLETVIGDPAAVDWLPPRPLLLALVARRRQQGRLPEAVDLVRRATAEQPQDLGLLLTELKVRTEVEEPSAVLAEFVDRLPETGPAEPRLRVQIAQAYLLRHEVGPAADLLGDAPPAADRPTRREWYRTRAMMYGIENDAASLAELSRRWNVAEGSPADVLAWHALTLSLYQLVDPDRPTTAMLRAAAARRDELEDPSVLPTLYTRLLGSLIVEGRHREALALYDEVAEPYGLEVSREEILRSERDRRVGDTELAVRRGTLRFQVPPDEGLLLWVSADGDVPLDSDFVPYPVPPDGRVEVERSVGTAPQRWVLKRGDLVLASGGAWPARGEVVDLAVRPRDRPPAATVFVPRQGRADGRRRVFNVILDCADWHLVQYGRTRGDLPVLDYLVRHGYRAVLESTPPFTAAAMHSLVSPERRSSLSPVGVIHMLGAELAGNAFVEGNPFAALSWLLPESPTFFDRLGAGDRVVLNLLFTEGLVQAGHHGEIRGPKARVRQFERWRPSRPLRAEERRRHPRLTGDPIRLGWIEEAAAGLDAALAAVEDREIDLLMLRIASLDLATHGGFSEVTATGQDDGGAALLSFYRYLDRRLGELFEQLDRDDILVVMSDHGIRTSMEHDRRAVFIAAGPVPVGRCPGTPHLRGLPRMLADLLGVETDWPATGIEAWVADLGEP